MEAVTAPLDSGEQAQLQAQLGDPNCVVVGVPWPSDEAPSRVGSLLDEDAPMAHSALAVAVPANASSEHSIAKEWEQLEAALEATISENLAPPPSGPATRSYVDPPKPKGGTRASPLWTFFKLFEPKPNSRENCECFCPPQLGKEGYTDPQTGIARCGQLFVYTNAGSASNLGRHLHRHHPEKHAEWQNASAHSKVSVQKKVETAAAATSQSRKLGFLPETMTAEERLDHHRRCATPHPSVACVS